MVQVISRGEFDIWIFSFLIAAVSFDIKITILLSCFHPFACPVADPVGDPVSDPEVLEGSKVEGNRVEGCFRD